MAAKAGEKEVDFSKIDLFVLDSITHLGELVKKEVMTKYPPTNKMGIPERQQWMMMGELIRQIMQGIENSEVRCYITGQQDLREEPAAGKGEGVALFLPDVQTKQRMRIMYDVDWMFYSFIMNGKPKVRTKHTNSTYSKTRGIELDAVLDFDLAAMFNLIVAKLQKNEEEFQQYLKEHGIENNA